MTWIVDLDDGLVDTTKTQRVKCANSTCDGYMNVTARLGWCCTICNDENAIFECSNATMYCSSGICQSCYDERYI